MDGHIAAAILGVTERARADEIRAAFRARVKATHPDLGGDPAEFGIALDAFAVLRHRTVTEPIAAPVVISATHGVPGSARIDAHDLPCRRRVTRSFADELRVAIAREACAPRH